jgi:peptidoglycan/LPS O-acetylase OafA/YrhL
LIVFLSHSVSPLQNLLLSTDGVAAVRMFFILSGYLMGKNFINGKYRFDFQSFKRFYINRFKRIAPLYYFVVISLFVFFYPELWDWSSWYKIITTLTFTFDYDARPYFTGSLWSLSVEMQFYIIAPLLIWIISRVSNNLRNTLFTIFTSLAVSLGFIFLYSRNLISTPNQVRHFLIHFFCFPVGISLNFLFKYLEIYLTKCKGWLILNSNRLFAFSLVIIYLILNTYTYYGNYINRPFATTFSYNLLSVFGVVLFTGISIYFAELNTTQVREFSWGRLIKNPLTFFEILGILSYGFYLWHGDVLYLTRQIIQVDNYVNYTLVLILGFVASAGLSFITYFLVEKNNLKAILKSKS